MTRIVAGVAGGRRLIVPPGGTRPTSERVREAMFSTLQARCDLDGARVLDLYAGSGALGLEALSRGAAHVRFVESDRRAAAVLRRNIELLGLGGGGGRRGPDHQGGPGEESGAGERSGAGSGAVQVSTATVAAVLRTDPGQPYDVVLADPPYALADDALTDVLAALVSGGWLAPAAVLVVERAATVAAPTWPGGVVALTQRRYGDTAVHYGSVI